MIWRYYCLRYFFTGKVYKRIYVNLQYVVCMLLPPFLAWWYYALTRAHKYKERWGTVQHATVRPKNKAYVLVMHSIFTSVDLYLTKVINAYLSWYKYV